MADLPTPVLLLARELNLGGTERQLTEIAKSLDRSRFTPHVGCYRPEGIRADELRAAGVPILHIPVRSLWKPSTISAARVMGRYIERHGIDLVHSFDVPLNVFGVPVARFFKVRRVLSSQRASRELTPGAMRHLLRIIDHLADAVVVNCEAMRQHLIQDEGVAAARIQLCYNGIDTGMFFSSAEPRGGNEPLVIGVVCALRPEKGLSTLIEAFAQLQVRPGRELRLLIVGSGSELESLQSLSRRLGITERCRFEPATEQVASCLRKIDIFVLPSLSEALSNSLMEAMACGCAVAASRVGGNPELVEDGRTGLLFPAGDAVGLASALRRMVDDAALRQEMAINAARFIRTGFSVKASARRMEEIYSRALSVVS